MKSCETNDRRLLHQRLNLKFDCWTLKFVSQVCTKCCRWWIHKEICCARWCRRRTKFYCCNIACNVSGNKYLGVDKRCNLATARNATPCVQALSLIKYQITICTWSWTSNEFFFFFFPERHLNCWGLLEFNFRSPKLVTNIYWANNVLSSDPARQRVVKCF